MGVTSRMNIEIIAPRTTPANRCWQEQVGGPVTKGGRCVTPLLKGVWPVHSLGAAVQLNGGMQPCTPFGSVGAHRDRPSLLMMLEKWLTMVRCRVGGKGTVGRVAAGKGSS